MDKRKLWGKHWKWRMEEERVRARVILWRWLNESDHWHGEWPEVYLVEDGPRVRDDPDTLVAVFAGTRPTGFADPERFETRADFPETDLEKWPVLPPTWHEGLRSYWPRRKGRKSRERS